MSAFPIRVVYRLVDQQPDMAQVQMLVSVPKKHFKRAVKRNRVKRQIRAMCNSLINYSDYTFDIVIVVREEFLKRSFNDNKVALNKLLSEIGITQ